MKPTRTRDKQYFHLRLVPGSMPVSQALLQAATRCVGPQGELYSDEVVANCLLFDLSPDVIVERLFGQNRKRGLRKPLRRLCFSCKKVLFLGDFPQHICSVDGQPPEQAENWGFDSPKVSELIPAKEMVEICAILAAKECPFCREKGFEGKCVKCGWAD